jgi:hypothetical protein
MVAGCVLFEGTLSGDLPVDFAALKPSRLATNDADSRPSALTSWPWPSAQKMEPHKGVTTWTKVAPDGTGLTLIQFDFARNRNLSFEIFDQTKTTRRCGITMSSIGRVALGKSPNS